MRGYYVDENFQEVSQGSILSTRVSEANIKKVLVKILIKLISNNSFGKFLSLLVTTLFNRTKIT